MTDLQPDRAETVACSLGRADLAERRLRWLRVAEDGHAEVQVNDHGLRLVFGARPEIERELEELAALEQDCCAFATWSVHKGAKELVLDVTAASVDGVSAVHAMFATMGLSH